MMVIITLTYPKVQLFPKLRVRKLPLPAHLLFLQLCLHDLGFP